LRGGDGLAVGCGWVVGSCGGLAVWRYGGVVGDEVQVHGGGGRVAGVELQGQGGAGVE
jgi:hypothetical protein